MTLNEFDLSAQLNTLRDMLVNERYQPAAPKIIHIPKSNGGKRTIGVLNVSDRVAQRATVQVLNPLWESEFAECSFGFRTGRGAMDAVRYVQTLRAQGHGWMVEADIEDCFNSLDHDLVLKRVRQRVPDGRVVNLLTRWLDAGVLGAGLPASPESAEAVEPDRWQRAGNGLKGGAGVLLEAAARRNARNICR